MAILNRTTKTTDKPQAQAPQPQPDMERLCSELAQAEQQVSELTQALASVDQVMQATTRRDILKRQIGILRDRAWQSKVNQLVAQHAAAYNEWQQLLPQLQANSDRDAQVVDLLNTTYARGGDGSRGDEWIEERIRLMAERERSHYRHVRLSTRIGELTDEMKRCDDELAIYHRVGTQAIDMNFFQLHPDRRAAGPSGMWIGGIFTPAPTPATDDAPPPPTPDIDIDIDEAEWVTA